MPKKFPTARRPQLVIEDITGRDSCIIIKALSYAITAINELPQWRREVSDCNDMIRLLTAMQGEHDQSLWQINIARSHMGLPELSAVPADPDFANMVTHDEFLAEAQADKAQVEDQNVIRGIFPHAK